MADKYQWKPGRGIDLGFIADHDKMLELEKIGAKPFYIRGYFKEGIRYSNGKQTLKTDIRDASAVRGEQRDHPEPDSSNAYSIPESEQHIVNNK